MAILDSKYCDKLDQFLSDFNNESQKKITLLIFFLATNLNTFDYAAV